MYTNNNKTYIKMEYTDFILHILYKAYSLLLKG